MAPAHEWANLNKSSECGLYRNMHRIMCDTDSSARTDVARETMCVCVRTNDRHLGPSQSAGKLCGKLTNAVAFDLLQ